MPKSKPHPILDRWPSRRAVYEDALSAEPSLEMIAVHRWYQRGLIPGKYDTALLVGAKRRGIKIQPQDLIDARGVHSDQDGQGSAVVQGDSA